MAFCSNCGAFIAEGAKFCENCGTPVAAAKAAEKVEEVKEEAQEAAEQAQQVVYATPVVPVAPVTQEAAPAKAPVNTTPALVMGILAMIFCEAGILGIIFGAIAISKAKQAGDAIDGKGKAGKILGTIGLVIGIIMTVVWIIYAIVFAVVGGGLLSQYLNNL
ncbi:MAG: zinc-ribbon domain-containing protein [Clostridia bacterium]|nr:zinc-ribbon domain-containing protein [Clostridia bacterium]